VAFQPLSRDLADPAKWKTQLFLPVE